MSNPADACAFATPVLALSLTAWGDGLLDTLRERTCERLGRVPPHCCLASTNGDLESQIRNALTEILNVRVVATPYVAGENGELGRLQPEIILAGSAAELKDQVERISLVVKALRKELRRSGIDGRIRLLVYAGVVAGQIPVDDTLLQLEALDSSLPVFVCSDADAMGRRLHEYDVAELAARFLFHYLHDEPVQQLVDRAMHPDRGVEHRIAIGVGRFDLSDSSVREYFRKTLRNQLSRFLFEPAKPSSLPPTPAAGQQVDPEWVANHLLGGRGSVGGMDLALQELSEFTGKHLQSARLATVAETTFESVAALISPAPCRQRRRGWFLALLARIWRWLTFWCLRTVDHSRTADLSSPPHEPSDVSPNEDDLIRAERLRIRLRHIDLALRERSSNPIGSKPLELQVIHRTEVRESLDGELPAIEDLAWSIAKTIPVEDLLADSPTPQQLRVRIDAICDEALCFEQRRHVVHPGDCRDLIDRALAATCPLYPMARDVIHRLALLPRGWLQTVELDGCETAIGQDGEVVFVTIQSGATFRSSLQGEEER